MSKDIKSNNGDESRGDIPQAHPPMRLVGQPAPAEPDIPPLSDEDQEALASSQRRQQVLRDLTRGCIDGNHTGAAPENGLGQVATNTGPIP
jgi:hypothetical protein